MNNKREKLDFDNKLTFGLEIEYYGSSLEKMRRYLNLIEKLNINSPYSKWTNTIEPSLGRGGKEIKSKILKNYKKYYKEIDFVLKKLREEKAVINGETGMHCHVSSSVFENNTNYLRNFLKLLSVYEDIIYKFAFNGTVPRNSMSICAKPIRDDLVYFLDKFYTTEFENYIKCIELKLTPCKTNGFNFKNMYSLDGETNLIKTVEFRIFNPSLDYDVILNNIDLSCNLMLSCKKDLDIDYLDYQIKKLRHEKTTLEKYKNINEEKAIEFSNIIYETEESKKYFLNQYLKH